MKKILLGVSDFKNLIENNGYYIDKTLFIKELIDIGAQVNLITRPRRFGKTLNLSTLYYFFNINEPENKELFKGLKIWQEKEIMEKYCCQYPVIFLTFKDVKADNWEESYNQIKNLIMELYERFYYLIEEKALKPFEIKKFEKILISFILCFRIDCKIPLVQRYLCFNRSKRASGASVYETASIS